MPNFKGKVSRKQSRTRAAGVKGLLLVVTVLVVWVAHSQGYFNDWLDCTNDEDTGNLCFTGCNATKLLVGEPFNCSAPGHECCDQFDSAYCSPLDTCTCRPGFEPFMLLHFQRFPVICLISGGQPCKAQHGFTQFTPYEYNNVMNLPYWSLNHNDTYQEMLVRLNEAVGYDKFHRDKFQKHLYYMGLIIHILENLQLEEYPSMVDWGCASGKCGDETHTCDWGVNPFFTYFQRPIPNRSLVAPPPMKLYPGWADPRRRRIGQERQRFSPTNQVSTPLVPGILTAIPTLLITVGHL